MRYSAKQWAAIKAKLKASGKWDEDRYLSAKDSYLPDTEPIEFDDLDPEVERDLVEAAEQVEGGKSYHMSNEFNCDLSNRAGTTSGKSSEREIYKADCFNSKNNMETYSKRNRPVHSNYFSIFHERGNFSGETRKAKRTLQFDEIGEYAGKRGRINRVSKTEEYLRDNCLMLHMQNSKGQVPKWGDFKEGVDVQEVNDLIEYFQSYNSIAVVIKCLPDELDTINSVDMFDALTKCISDPFVLVCERSQEGVLHWHMIWLTSKRTDNAKRLLQKSLEKVSKNFSIGCQQTKSFKHYMRYILKEPVSLGVGNSDHLANYAYAIMLEDVVYTAPTKQTPDNKMIDQLLKTMKEHNVYTTEELMRVAPDVMMNYLQKSNLDSIVQNCKLFLLKPNNSRSTLERITHGCDMGSWFMLYAFIVHQGINPLTFLLDFFNIFCRIPKKLNVFCIQGASNSGKTTFLRPLLEMVSFGEIVSGGQFMFQNCINKELLIWEEPLIGPDYVEMCKRVFEGMTTQVPVKFKAPQTLHRTPILITSNKDVWHYCTGDEAALRNRMILYFFETDAQEIKSRSRDWWRSCYEAYCGCCRLLSEYFSGSDAERPTRFESDWPAPSLTDCWDCEPVDTERQPGSPVSEPVDCRANKSTSW